MLSHEWRELEVLCERISDLRHRLGSAQKTKNSGLIDGLKDDLNRAVRMRAQLVQHISARLGSATAERAFNAKNGAPTSNNQVPDEIEPVFGEDLEGFAG